ncbi:MAG: PKD domain-containing protein [Candidatus Bipolaricaulis sp.]|nr:PKD domain-containing protein [Candidatus Bipolaricaulis sp.]
MKRFMLLLAVVGLAVPSALAVTFTNVDLGFENDAAEVAPGEWVLAQKIQADTAVEISKVAVYNEAGSPKVAGADVERIELRRASDGKVMGSASTTTALAKLADADGVSISTTANKVIAASGYIEVWVKLRATVPLGRKLKLGGTKVTYNPDVDVTYPEDAPATVFTVGPSPDIAFDGTVGDADVYRGERFLAGRIKVDAETLSFETTISRLFLENVANAGAIPLSGSYVAAIEVRRASDGLLLGEGTSTEIAKLTTTGTAIPTSSNNKIPPYSTVFLEIWVTLKADAPTSHKLQLKVDVRCGGTDFAAGKTPTFTVGQPGGFEATNLDLEGGRVFSRQRFLAQRIKVVDGDLDPYDVTINSLVVQNVADPEARLADTQITKVEVVRARDGAALGSVTNTSGLNSGGVRITTGTNNVVRDDTTEIIELWVTLGDNVPHERDIQLSTVIWHTEDTKTFRNPEEGGLDGAVFTTGPAEAKGFEEAKRDETLTDRKVFQGVRFLAQRLILKDTDPDPYDVTITSLMVRNAEATSPLADQQVARIEVRRKSDGALLGEVTDPMGLSLAGVRVTTGANNIVPDDSTVEIDIWVTIKATAPAGRKLKLEAVVWHTEGVDTHQTDALLGPATFTTAIGKAPTGVDFSWAPTQPTWQDEVTFTPATGIIDPEGDITKATFHWNFGDGTTKSTTGSAAVKHKYGKGGTFSVTLTVTGQGGLSSSKARSITVAGRAPTVNFTYTPTAPMAGQEITFTSQVTDPADPPLTPYTYAWDFGDGAKSSETNPKHTYSAAGTFKVKLSVTNKNGETGSAEKTVTVAAAVNVPPTVTSLAANPANPEVGVEITFTAGTTTPSGDPVTGWEWKFGDGHESSSPSPVKHTYTASGVFTVSVRAKNAKGGWSPARTMTLYVRPQGGALIGTKILDNPASTQCRIQVFLPQGATGVRIQIFDALGRPVLTKDVAGSQFTWDLKDDRGRAIADGLYVYLITATVSEKTERSEIGRILVVR